MPYVQCGETLFINVDLSSSSTKFSGPVVMMLGPVVNYVYPGVIFLVPRVIDFLVKIHHFSTQIKSVSPECTPFLINFSVINRDRRSLRHKP